MEITSSIEIANTSTGTTSAGNPPVIPIVFDGSYKGDETTRRAAEILAMPDIHGWTVVDSDEDTALVHYRDDADKSVYGHIRGLFLDLEVGAVIADSFGYTPTAVASELTETEGCVVIKDKEGVTHNFPIGEAIVKRVFEGVVIRVIWRKNKLYRITHRKINPVRSRWGSSKSFIEMYEAAGGPTAEQLFDTTKPYSSTCYDFLVVDQSLLVGSRQKVDKPYIVCLAQRNMDIKRPEEEVALGRASFITSETISGAVTESMIHDPKQLSIEEANRHLKYGYYNEFPVEDIRQLTGEAIIIYRMTNDTVTDIVKVHSPSYEWRVNLRGNNPNIVNQFYALLNSCYNDINSNEDWDKFKSKFITLPLYNETSLADLYTTNGAILMIPSGEISREDYNTRDSRIHLLWMNYLLSLPPHMQQNALQLLTNFKNDRNDLITWLQNLEETTKNIETSELPERIKGLISSSRRLARERVTNRTNYSAKGSYMKLPLLIKSTLRNLVNKENGPSLYGLVRDMKVARNPPKILPQVAPEVASEVAPEVTPEVAPEVAPEVIPNQNDTPQ